MHIQPHRTHQKLVIERLASSLKARLVTLQAWAASATRATYVMRSILAASLALTVAYSLQLEMPYSAASTVLLVINPIQGAVIGKGTWRILGTLAGMLVALMLMAAFAQMPWLFILGFGLWLGLCVAGMTLLRHFRGSGAVVAGYTIGLATFGAMQHPELAFDHAIGRTSTVVVGVVCLGLVSALFSTRSVRGRLEAQLTHLAAAVARNLASASQASAEGSMDRRADQARQGLTAEIYAMDDLLALGKAESADLARRAAVVRHGMSSLSAALMGTPPLPPHTTNRQAALLRHAWEAAGDVLSHSPQGVEETVASLRQTRQRLVEKPDIQVQNGPAECAHRLIATDRLIEQLDDYLAALEGIVALRQPRPLSTGEPVRFHRDWHAATRNGLRSALAIILGGAFWIATGWPHGDMMLLVLAPYCALLATAGNPAAGAVAFIKGTLIAVPLAFICAFGVLPHIEGLPLLLVVLALFWLPGIYATSLPRHALAGLTYLVGFNTLAAAENPMHYDPALFLNWSVAWVLATFFTLLSFRLLLPRNLTRDLERLSNRIRDEGLAVLRGKGVDRHGWQQRQQHRIALLGTLLRDQPGATAQAIGDSLASLHLGRELLRVRAWLRREQPASAPGTRVEIALRHMACRADSPNLAALHARRAARQLLQSESSDPADHLRVGAALLDIATLLQGHASYFSSSPRSHRNAQ